MKCGSEVATPHCEHSKAVEPGKKDNAGNVRCILICLVPLQPAVSRTSEIYNIRKGKDEASGRSRLRWGWLPTP